MTPCSASWQATLAFELGRTVDAEESLRTAVRLEPSNGETYIELGQMLQASGRPAEAAAAFRGALRKRRLADRAGTHAQLAEALGAVAAAQAAAGGAGASSVEDAADAAVAEYERAVWLAPAAVHLLTGLTGVHSQAGRHSEAAATARAALALAPTDSHAAHFNLATSLARLGRPAEAERSYRRAVGLAPSEAAYYQGLGVHYHGLGRAAEALPWYATALTLMAARGEPRSIDLEYDVATAYREAGRHDEAVLSAQRALALRPLEPDGRVLVEAALREAGRHAEAELVALRPSGPSGSDGDAGEGRAGGAGSEGPAERTRTHGRAGSEEVFIELEL